MYIYTEIQDPTSVTVVWTGTARKCGKRTRTGDEDRGHQRGPQCPRRVTAVVGTGGRGDGGGYSSMVQQGQQRVVLAAASGGPPGCCRSTTAAAEGALALRSLLMGQEPFLSCPSPEKTCFLSRNRNVETQQFSLVLDKNGTWWFFSKLCWVKTRKRRNSSSLKPW